MICVSSDTRRDCGCEFLADFHNCLASQMLQQRKAAEIARAVAAAAAAAEEEAAAEELRRAQAEVLRQQRLQLHQVRTPKRFYSRDSFNLTLLQLQVEAELAASLRREFAVLAGVHWRVIVSRKVWRLWNR